MASKKPSRRLAADEPSGYQSAFPKTSLEKYVPDEDSEDNHPSKTSRSRTQKPQPSSSRREYERDDSDESPAEDRRKQKATARLSRCDDRRERYDDCDDDRYGGSRRDIGNRACDRSESRSRSRSSHRTSATAMVKRGESSTAVTKRDTRSRADAKTTGSSRARRGYSDDEEDVIKISRYTTIDFHNMNPDAVEMLCKCLDVRASKVKQWCERDLIRHDKITGLLDAKRLIDVVDEEDAKKLRRFIDQMKNKKEARMISGAHIQHGRHDHHHHPHSSTWIRHPHTENLIIEYCMECYQLSKACLIHGGLVNQAYFEYNHGRR